MQRNIFYFILLLLSIPLGVSAQIGSGLPGGSTTIRTEPRYPTPGSEVRLIVTSYEGDETSALITWFENGKLLEQGRGLTEVTIITPDAGKRTSIVANLELTNGKKVAGEYILSPASVSIIPQADTYVPPFYKGKAIPTIGSDTYLIAIPEFFNSDGSITDPDILSYEWWSDGGELENSTRAVAKLKNPIFIRPIRVLVTVKGPNNQTARNDIVIPPRRPSIVLYNYNPIFGIWYNNAIPPSFSIGNSEVEVHAEPYFFAKKMVSSLSYDWGLPGNVAPFRSSNNSLVLRPEEGASGTSVITLTAHDITKSITSFLQEAKTSFSVFYTSDQGGQSGNTTTESPGGNSLPNF